MTPHEFRAARKRLGLSQIGFATLCGVDARSVRRWERGQVPIPGPAARVMQALTLAPHLVDALRTAKKPWDGLPPKQKEDGTHMIASDIGAWLGQWYAGERIWHVRGFVKPEEMALLGFHYAGPSPSPDVEAQYPAPYPAPPRRHAAAGRRSSSRL
jgi:transcriptional regulator with XRE-family HTH domain